jgi:hypothetical protein
MKKQSWLLIGINLAMGFIFQGCMLVHLADVHHSGMRGYGAKTGGGKYDGKREAAKSLGGVDDDFGPLGLNFLRVVGRA